MKKIIYLGSLFAFLVFSAGCKKDWLSELGTNPNQPSEAPLQLMLPSVLTGFASLEVSLNTRVGIWMGYGSFAGGYSIDDNTLTYYVNQGNPSIWGYYDVLKNADYIEKRAKEIDNMDNFVAVAKILKAFGFQKLVDAYGKVPYTEAFEGVKNFFPKYDDGKDIYAANLAQLDSAIAIIQGASVNVITLGDNDILYGGNMNKWLKFANTLKLKYLIRESAVVGAGGQSELAKTASIGFIEEDANVNPGYLNSAGKQSPLWSSFATDPGGSLYSDGYKFIRGGGAGVEFLLNNNDPRLFYIYAPANGMSPDNKNFFNLDDSSNYVGVYYGDRPTATSLGTNKVSGVGNGILSGFSASVALISAAQSYFLQAEATLKGWLAGGDAAAEILYQKGITASFKTLGVFGDKAAQAATDYYSQDIDLVGWDASSNKLKAIITQKWISMAFTHPMEAWAEYRRTGYPDETTLPATKFPGYNRHMPTILWYPKSEQDTNGKNYTDAGGPSTDPQNQKVFWDL